MWLSRHHLHCWPSFVEDKEEEEEEEEKGGKRRKKEDTTKMFAPQKDVENEQTSKRGLVRLSERGLNFPEVGKRSGSDVVGWWEKTMTFRFVISLRFVPSVLGHISDPVIGMRSARPDVSLIMASGPSSDLGSLHPLPDMEDPHIRIFPRSYFSFSFNLISALHPFPPSFLFSLH